MVVISRLVRLSLAAAAATLMVLMSGDGGVAPANAPGQATTTLTVQVTDIAADPNPDAAGWGRVTSSPAGIDCPGDCAEDFPSGTTVRLTVTALPGYTFAQWGVFGTEAGSDCGAELQCTLPIGDAGGALVTAALRPEAQLHLLPEGAGTLSIDPVEAGRPTAACTVPVPVFDPLPDVCTPRYPAGTRVTLTAVPDPDVPDARFVRWSDYRCPRHRPTCTLTVRGDRHLSAFFTPAFLTVVPGSFGAVTLPPPGGRCTFDADPITGVEAPCQFPYPLDDVVTLERDPAAAQDPSHEWTGSCTGAGLTCSLRMRRNEHVRAGTDPELDIPTRVGVSIRLIAAGRRRGRITLRPLTGAGRPAVCRRLCSPAGYRRGDRVLIRAKGTRRARFVRWADIRARAATRSLYIGDRSPVKAIFRRR